MTPYFYVYLIIMVIIITLLIRWFILKKKNIPAILFDEALKKENSGHYEEALINYQKALLEVRKIKYHRDLKIKITAKLKLLQTIINYHNNFQHAAITVVDTHN